MILLRMPSLTSIVNDGNVVVEPAESKNEKDPQVKQPRSSVLHRSLHEDPLHVVKAQGNYLHLTNGQKVFDATGGAAVSCLGHGNKR